MPASEPLTLRGLIARAGGAGREVETRIGRVALDEIAVHTPFGAQREQLTGRRVALAVSDMAEAAAALIDLDGLARAVLLCPPGWSAAEVAAAATRAGANVLVTGPSASAEPPFDTVVSLGAPAPLGAVPAMLETEWILPTSGTSGPPKLAVHTLHTLMGAITDAPLQQWATFYDIRRYGGLQIFLRAIAGAGSLRISSQGEPVEAYLDRLGAANVTHISGTPTHWRKALIAGAASRFAPEYVRLSGEIADDAILRGLAAAFPHARIEHAYASTEAGVGFTVNDGRAGFPAAFLDRGGEVAMRVVEGTLRIRSPRAALKLIGEETALADAEGFVDTGDMVELQDDRYLFLGRRGGVINVGGAKVHPETVEAAINAHAAVRASRVFSRPNPITGALVAAEVVLKDGALAPEGLDREIAAFVRRTLPSHMAPARIRFVADLPMTDAGKLARNG